MLQEGSGSRVLMLQEGSGSGVPMLQEGSGSQVPMLQEGSGSRVLMLAALPLDEVGDVSGQDEPSGLHTELLPPGYSRLGGGREVGGEGGGQGGEAKAGDLEDRVGVGFRLRVAGQAVGGGGGAALLHGGGEDVRDGLEQFCPGVWGRVGSGKDWSQGRMRGKMR